MVYSNRAIKVSSTTIGNGAGRGSKLYELTTRKGRTGVDYVLAGYFRTKKEATKAKYAYNKKNPYK